MGGCCSLLCNCSRFSLCRAFSASTWKGKSLSFWETVCFNDLHWLSILDENKSKSTRIVSPNYTKRILCIQFYSIIFVLCILGLMIEKPHIDCYSCFVLGNPVLDAWESRCTLWSLAETKRRFPLYLLLEFQSFFFYFVFVKKYTLLFDLGSSVK